MHEIGAKEVEKLFPLCRTDDVLAGFYVAVLSLLPPIVTPLHCRGAMSH